MTAADQEVAQALQDLVDQHRIQNAVLLEIVRLLEESNARDRHGRELSSTSLANSVEDRALELQEAIDLDRVDKIVETTP